jgi:hypothetical protein
MLVLGLALAEADPARRLAQALEAERLGCESSTTGKSSRVIRLSGAPRRSARRRAA